MIPEVGVTIRERSGYMELMIPKDTWEVCPIERYIKAVKRSPAETIKGVVGIDLDGKVPVLDIDGVLISGIRRGGKSTAMRTLLTSLMKWYHPSHLKILLIDTDGLNLTKFRDAPHLYAEVITTSEEALDALHYLLKVEMKQRRETFSRYPDLDDICEYNRMFPNNPIPWIAVAIEELAMLSDLTEKQVYKYLEPLLGQSGKYGIVFILGTQRPDKDVISQIVKANLDLRIALKVSSPENSKIALDVEKRYVDASQLGFKGDMWLKFEGQLYRMQGLLTSKPYLKEFIEELVVRYGDCKASRIKFPHQEHFPAEGKKKSA